MWGVVLIHSFPIQILKLFQAMIKKRRERERGEIIVPRTGLSFPLD